MIEWGERDPKNQATMGIVGLKRPLRRSYKELFIRHYDGIREVCSRFDEPGVAVFAIDARKNRLDSSAWVVAKPGVPNSAIIGRHSMADLHLPSDPSISLRHLALIIDPVSNWSREELDVSYSILDLRTTDGFEDEHGRGMRGLRIEGPSFIRCGEYAIFIMVTGDRTPWPERGEDAWECLPERVYLDERLGQGTGSHGYRARAAAARGKHGGRRTFIQQTLGPLTTEHDLLRGDEESLGELRVRTSVRRSVFELGPEAAREGVLLGRYHRCERSGVLADARISRVHVLLIEIADQLWAIDVASTCGTWRVSKTRRLVESRVTPLESRTKLILADRVAELRWKNV